ncbi:LysE family translocator [Vibrio tritonius]|uniref:LysE family translocator n=1 Tax=Vibrio tritonius TaxID=1435069 RepID=UPI00315D8491
MTKCSTNHRHRIQLLIVCLVAIGAGGLLAQLPSWFLVMKCVGGAYLIYLGIKSLRSKPKNSMTLPNGADRAEQKGLLSLYLQAFLFRPVILRH